MEDIPRNSSVRIKVREKSLPLFTTILQSGIEIHSTTNTSIGQFLSQLRCLTSDYITETVQTIFLNGTAVDDLSLPLTGNRPVLAISGAMPGLAGAIFRKNSFHAALRTETRLTDTPGNVAQSNTVILKLFNRIARERGAELLAQGVTMKSHSIKNFLARRPALWQDVSNIESAGSNLSSEAFLNLLGKNETISVIIAYDDERDN